MYSKNLEKCLWCGLFCESCGITYHSLLNVKYKKGPRNLTQVLFAALKYKKALTVMLKENLRFKELRLNYINSQKKRPEKERLRLVISSVRVGVVA